MGLLENGKDLLKVPSGRPNTGFCITIFLRKGVMAIAGINKVLIKKEMLYYTIFLQRNNPFYNPGEEIKRGRVFSVWRGADGCNIYHRISPVGKGGERRYYNKKMIFFLPFLFSFLFSFTNCRSSPPPPMASYSGKRIQVKIPMRDGVRLSTYITFPSSPPPYPAIIVRTPYGIYPLGIDQVFLPYGYAVVQQDTRGRFDSEGEFVPIRYEYQDGEDTLKYIEQQPWFNGKAGVWGASYLGLTAMAMAIARPDLVKGAFIAVIPSNLYSAGFVHGMLRGDLATFWAPLMRKKDRLSNDLPSPVTSFITQFPLIDLDERMGFTIPFKGDIFQHTTDGPYYRDVINPEKWWKNEVPTYIFEGWYDLFVEGAIRDFLEKEKFRNGKDLFLVVGPWTHSMMSLPPQELIFPEGSGIPFFMAEAVSFFNTYVKGEGELPFPRIRIYDMGERRWITRETLFSPTGNLNYYFHITSTTCPQGVLLPDPPPSFASHSYLYNPYNPLILKGGLVLGFEDGIRKEQNYCERSDTIVFYTPPFGETVIVSGFPTISLKVRANVEDSTLFFRWFFVTEEGVPYNLRETALTLTHREGDFTEIPYPVGEWVKIRISLPPLYFTFKKGERWGVVLTSSGFPLILPHPNGKPWYSFAPGITAQVEWGVDGETVFSVPVEKFF